MEMYEVCAKCGHVGRNRYVEKTFAVKAENGKEAASIVRKFPRVKHDYKDAIKYVIKINEERFFEIKENNSLDPYFTCKNVQEQRARCELDIKDEEQVIRKARMERETSTMYRSKVLIRNPKRYMKMYAI